VRPAINEEMGATAIWGTQQLQLSPGAKKDGVIRRHQLRRDGTVGDTVMYSVLSQEWPEVKRNLLYRLAI